MTTGRINQVATNRVRSSTTEVEAPRWCSQVCVEFRLRPCISFAIVLYHCSAPASALLDQTVERSAARKTCSGAPATIGIQSLLGTPPRPRYQVRVTKSIGWLRSNHWSVQLQQGYRSSENGWRSTRWKSKKRKANQGFANQAFARCQPAEAQWSTSPERFETRGEEKKKLKINNSSIISK